MKRYHLPTELHERVDYHLLTLNVEQARYHSKERRTFAPLMAEPHPVKFFVLQTKRTQGLVGARSKMEAIHKFLTDNPDELSNCFEPTPAQQRFVDANPDDMHTIRGTPLKLEHGFIFFGDIFVQEEPKPDAVFTWSAPAPIGKQEMTQYTIQLNAPQAEFITKYKNVTGEKFSEKAIQRLLSGTHQLLDQGRLSETFSQFIGKQTGHAPMLCSRSEVRRLESQGREFDNLHLQIQALKVKVAKRDEKLLEAPKAVKEMPTFKSESEIIPEPKHWWEKLTMKRGKNA